MNNASEEVQFLLIHLDREVFEPLFIKLLSSGVSIEMLDPRELGPKWQGISFLNSTEFGDVNSENVLKLRQIEKTIEQYSPVYSFEEKKESGNVDAVLENWQEKYLFDAVQRLNSSSIINKKFLQQKSILKKVKNEWQVTILKDLKALYTKYEIISNFSLIYKKFFRLEKDSNLVFGCFAVRHQEVQKTKDLLSEYQIDSEVTGWNKKFVVVNQNKELIYNLPTSNLSQNWTKFLIFLYYFLSALVIHDIFVGFLIIIICIIAYRFELKNKAFLSQVWTGFGAIVLGIVGGSFAGNLLPILSMSKFLVVKEIGNGLLGFLSLFQVIDWTNQNPNLLLNYNLAAQSFSPIALLFLTFFIISLFVIVFGQLIKVASEYKNSNFRKVIVRVIFVVTTVSGTLSIFSLIPIWITLVLGLLLFVYQPGLQIGNKAKTFVTSEFGIYGYVKLFVQWLWLAAVFGILIFSTLIFNTANSLIGDNVVVLLLIDTVMSLLLWQIVAFIVAKTLKVNIIDQTAQFQNSQERTFNPLSRYKYWKF
jgi:hypothetical protein